MSLLAGLQSINIALRFLLELCSLFAVGYWGYKTGESLVVQWILAVGGPLVLAVIWGLMGSPKAPIKLSEPFYFILEIIVFGLPVLLLALLGKNELAWFIGIVVVINKILMIIWKQ
ncbi:MULTISPECIES: YrdB family protein [Neobacillus]|uniref:YrdB family protein n=1 Tax=Neobacillus rhizophilus TaxID=2833579 RepID=A0A942U115_9BACI|nr:MULTISPECIES: YrdB family protein [Neobacillus]MBS4211295.1 YrdB family protein [Neobacillus rhizophilus]